MEHADGCASFLFREAELLDHQQLTEWLELLMPDIDYRAPVRLTPERAGGAGFSERAFYFKETFGSLKTRVARLSSEFAWAENPPTRTRRLVSNVHVRARPGGGDEVELTNNLALYCYRGDSPTPIVVTAERQDVLRRSNGGWKLARRLVLLDATVLGLQSLSVFL